jgi:hypothetical protein
MQTRLLFLGMVMMNMTVTSWAQTATLHAVEENGPRAQRINIVFLSEGYTTTNMPNFATHVSNAVNFLFTREPWQQYRSYCNVYRIEIASNQSGCDNGNTSGSGGVRDTYFNAGFNTPSVTQLLTLGSGGSTRAYSLLNTHVPEYDVPVVIVNDSKYGGAGGSLSVASVNGSSAAVVEHEIGHSFASLADEYDTEYLIYTPAERANNTAQTSRALIRWNHWIEATTPIPTPETATYDSLVGLFEGSMYRTSGWYRPHNNSLMKNLNRPCGAVNREQFVKQFYTRVSPLDGFTPSSTSATVTAPTALSFQVTPKVPSIGPALQVSWYVDGVLRVGQTTSQFTTLSDYLGNGAHTITATVQDPTPFVRLDASGLLNESVTWNFTLSGQIPGTLAAWRSAYGNDADVNTPDRLPNLVKYALGLNSSIPAAAAETPAAGTHQESSQRYLSLTVPRRMRRSDVTYTVEVSGNLGLWSSGTGHTVTLQDDETQLVVRDALPITGDQQRFIRLAVQPLP